MDDLAHQVAAETLSVPLGWTFHLNETVEAHWVQAGGKVVVLTRA